MYGTDPNNGEPLSRMLPKSVYELAETYPYEFWANYKQDLMKSFLDRNNMKFQSAMHLACACAQAIVWCEQHPLYAEKSSTSDGEWIVRIELRKRVLTLSRLLDFIRVAPNNWHYGVPKRGEDFLEVKKAVEQWIYHDKFEGVNAGFYNASIIGADLGLKTLASLELQGGKEPIKVQSTKQLTDEELKDALAERGLPAELLGSFLGLPAQEDEERAASESQPGGDPEDFEAGN